MHKFSQCLIMRGAPQFRGPDCHHLSWVLHSDQLAATSPSDCSSIVSTSIIAICSPNAALSCAARGDGLVACCSSAADSTPGISSALLHGW